MITKVNIIIFCALLMTLSSCDSSKNNGGLLTNGKSRTWKVDKMIFSDEKNNLTAGAAMRDSNINIFYNFSEDENLFIYGLYNSNINNNIAGDTSYMYKPKWKYEMGEIVFYTRDENPNIRKPHSFIIQEITDKTLSVHTKGLSIEFVVFEN